jgi:hypothetical protein
VSARRTLTVRRALTTRVSRRTRMVRGGDLYLRLVGSPAAGWWLTERPGRVFADGAVTLRAYDPVRSVALLAGRRYRAVRLDKRGKVEDSAVVNPDAPVTLAVNAGATVLGYPCVRIAEGELAKYWLRLGAGAELH